MKAKGGEFAIMKAAGCSYYKTDQVVGFQGPLGLYCQEPVKNKNLSNYCETWHLDLAFGAESKNGNRFARNVFVDQEFRLQKFDHRHYS